MRIEKGKIAILLSGRGSNFEAIYENSNNGNSTFEISLVISDKKKAKGLETAKRFGIPTFFVRPRNFQSKKNYEQHLISLFEKYDIDLICLAGFMRIISPVLIRSYPNKIINIHPSLLPAFPGLNAQKQALNSKNGVSGCTVHFVDEGVDSGPIIMQESVEIEEGDNEESLSARILKAEHRIYSEVIKLFFQKKLKIKGRKVKILS